MTFGRNDDQLVAGEKNGKRLGWKAEVQTSVLGKLNEEWRTQLLSSITVYSLRMAAVT